MLQNDQLIFISVFYICYTLFSILIQQSIIRTEGSITNSYFQKQSSIHHLAFQHPQSNFYNTSTFWKIQSHSLTSTQLILNYMSYPRKTHRIRKQLIREPVNQDEDSSQQQDIDRSEDEITTNQKVSCFKQTNKEEQTCKKLMKIDPRTVSNLSEQQREKIKVEHPQMNQYFLMTSRDKSKFFHLLNQKYRSQIKLSEPPGSAPMKKTIRFKKRFQIKHFSYVQKCQMIKARKSKMQLYKAKDQSKPKNISKFPRNI